MWDSDSLVQAYHSTATFGCVVCVQVAKQFLAERVPFVVADSVMLRPNMSTKDTFVLPEYPSSPNAPSSFATDVEYVYFIFGTYCIVGMVMHVACWFYSGCKLSNSLHYREEETKTSSSQNPPFYKSCKLSLLFESFILFCFAFLGYSIDGTFCGFGLSFTVNVLHWATRDASNLVFLYVIFMLTCCIMSIALARFFQAKTLMIVNTLTSLGGCVLMVSMIRISQFSLWIGACLLGLGFGNLLGNTLNAGKRLTDQTSVISSVVFAGGYTGRIVSPQVIGYLLDHEDPMWFLYICVVYSCAMLVPSIVFPIVLFCSNRYENVQQQECEAAPENV